MNDTRDISVYRWVVVIFVGFMLLTLVSGGLATVWLRQGISQVAADNDQLARQIMDIDRKRERLDAQIAQVHHPDYLISRAQRNLRPTNDRAQVVWMGDMGQPVPAPEKFVARAEHSPLTISFDLALLESSERSQRNL